MSLLEEKAKRDVKVPKPAAFGALASNTVETCVKEKVDADCLSVFSPFLTEGYVSLVGSNEEVPVKILRDTGAMDSFILESI